MAWSARMTLSFASGDPVVAGDDHDVGQVQRPQRGPELAAPAVHLVGGGPHARGAPAAIRRLACAMASSGFVANASFPGIPAFARRCGSFAQQSGMYTSKSDPCLPERGDQGGEHPG